MGLGSHTPQGAGMREIGKLRKLLYAKSERTGRMKRPYALGVERSYQHPSDGQNGHGKGNGISENL